MHSELLLSDPLLQWPCLLALNLWLEHVVCSGSAGHHNTPESQNLLHADVTMCFNGRIHDVQQWAAHCFVSSPVLVLAMSVQYYNTEYRVHQQEAKALQQNHQLIGLLNTMMKPSLFQHTDKTQECITG